jgi:hypothetical protein
MMRRGFDVTQPFFFRSFPEYASTISPDLREDGELHFQIHDRVLTRTRDIPYFSQLVALEYLSEGVYASHSSGEGYGRLRRLRGRLKLMLEIEKESVSDATRYAREALLRETTYLRQRALRPWRLPKACRTYPPVYRHAEWLRANRVYRQRYMDLLEQARSSPISSIDPCALIAWADAIHRREVAFDPLLLGRLITLCLWRGLWPSKLASAPRHPKA